MSGGSVAVVFPTAAPHCVNSVPTARQIRVDPTLRILCRSVVMAGIVQVRVTVAPLRAARKSKGGFGKSSEGGNGGPIVAHEASIRAVPQLRTEAKRERLIEKGQPIRTRFDQVAPEERARTSLKV